MITLMISSNRGIRVRKRNGRSRQIKNTGEKEEGRRCRIEQKET
jgi:hypothetical protein